MKYENAVEFVKQELEMLKQAGIVRAISSESFPGGVRLEADIGGTFTIVISEGADGNAIISPFANFEGCDRCFECFPYFDIAPAVIRAAKDIETGNYEYEWEGGAYYEDYDEDYDEE